MTALAALAAVTPGEAQAELYRLTAPEDGLVGSLATTYARQEETLLDIARLHGFGYRDLQLANPHLDALLPGEGAPVTLPSHYVLPRSTTRDLVVNIPEMRLYYYPRNLRDTVHTYPIGIGREGWNIPYTRTRVLGKAQNPGWHPPESIRQEHELWGDPLPAYVPPGPDNPLGDFAIRLALPGYLIHGTNRPGGIGMRVSHGCIRMYPEDIDEVFPLVPIGLAVEIVNQPIKLGVDGELLYLEVHPPLSEEDWDRTRLIRTLAVLLEDTVQGFYYWLDWQLAVRVLEEAHGIPIVVGQLSDLNAGS